MNPSTVTIHKLYMNTSTLSTVYTTRLVDRAVGDDDHPGGGDGDGEVCQQRPDKLDLVVEVVRPHRGAGVHQEHQVSLPALTCNQQGSLYNTVLYTTVYITGG